MRFKTLKRDSRLTKLVDKYAVREYVFETIGEEYLVPLIGVYSKVEDIDFNKLPKRFILKLNHGSGWNVICQDKAKFDIEDVISKLGSWLKQNYYLLGREYPYKNVIPKIVCEELVSRPDGEELMDYKFFCFYGEPKFIQADVDRETNHAINIYDLNWQQVPVSLQYPRSNKKVAIPSNFELMKKLARKLSKGFDFVRVDFYNLNGKIYFGEMTFFPGNCADSIDPIEYDLEWGNFFVKGKK